MLKIHGKVLSIGLVINPDSNNSENVVEILSPIDGVKVTVTGLNNKRCGELGTLFFKDVAVTIEESKPE